MDYTSIQIHRGTRIKLQSFKDYRRETYDELLNKMMNIIDALKDEPELREEVIEEVFEARKEAKEGKTYSTRKLLKELGVKG